MIDRLTGVEDRFSEVEKLLSDPGIIQNREAYQNIAGNMLNLTKL